MNMFQCVGSPIVISLPHFYDADPSLLQQIESGLHPNKKEHSVFIHFESVSNLISHLNENIYLTIFILFIDYR